MLKQCLAHQIPECSEQLSGLTVEQPVQEEESREDNMYATGYLDYYTPTAFSTARRTTAIVVVWGDFESHLTTL